jgi:hypothetical protein
MDCRIGGSESTGGTYTRGLEICTLSSILHPQSAKLSDLFVGFKSIVRPAIPFQY